MEGESFGPDALRGLEVRSTMEKPLTQLIRILPGVQYPPKFYSMTLGRSGGVFNLSPKISAIHVK